MSGARKGRHARVSCVVDAGPHARIACVWPGGVIESGCGAIYDPTGIALRSQDVDGDWATWHEQVPPELQERFGHDFPSCGGLDAPVYHGCFT